jgi:hypothetical protein
VLWSPLIEKITPTGSALLAVRSAFLSQRVFQTYGAYASDQLKKVSARRSRTGETNFKQAMHMIRLLMAGVHVLETGSVLVDVGFARDRLLAIRSGALDWESITTWAESLQSSLSQAAAKTAPVTRSRQNRSTACPRTGRRVCRDHRSAIVGRRDRPRPPLPVDLRDRQWRPPVRLRLRVLLTGLHLMRTGQLETDFSVAR